jgi:glycosyltransferase involved in cell wall biosynthesis
MGVMVMAQSCEVLSIVVPIHNEQGNLHKLHSQISESLAGRGLTYELILVDDGSTDDSYAEMTSILECEPRAVLIQLSRRFGQASAIEAGLREACGNVIVTLDADGQNDPSDIPLLLEQINRGYDVVFGWRKNRRDALVRTLPSKCANWLIKKVAPFPGHDLGCTLRAMKREFSDELSLYGELHRFIPILLNYSGARCAEVVVTHHPRKAGKSKYGIGRTVRVILDLITVKFMITYANTPMRFFGTIGLTCIAAGIVAGVGSVISRGANGGDMASNSFLLMGFGGVLIGLQAMALGTLGELCVRAYYESRGKRPYIRRKVERFGVRNPLTGTKAPNMSEQSEGITSVSSKL